LGSFFHEDNDDGNGNDLINPRNKNIAAPPQIQVVLNQPGDMDDLELEMVDNLDRAMEGLTNFLVA
jgi:E3 ubiquitin-protein ligase MARCH6